MYGRARQAGGRGFTLIELLTVVAIIVLLSTIAVPNVIRILRRGALTKTEADIDNLKTALEQYRQAFGGYPGDVFPSEDVNNNGTLEAGELGVDVDGDGTVDYALIANGRIDAGDGVVNIRDLEWALRTTARGGPFIDDFPTDGWGQEYMYAAPFTRSLSDGDTLAPTAISSAQFVYLDPAGSIHVSEDTDGDGFANNDDGIAEYATAADGTTRTAAFLTMRAGENNGILDYSDNVNGDVDGMNNDLITFSDNNGTQPNVQVVDTWELGNADISPDGYARNRGYYLYSIGFDGADNSHSGYEDITGDNILTTDVPAAVTAGGTIRNTMPTEDLNPGTGQVSGDLDTGYEDTGVDGRANTHDSGEGDGLVTTGDGATPASEEFAGAQAAQRTFGAPSVTPAIDGLDIGGDDINSWNETKPWRNHANYN